MADNNSQPIRVVVDYAPAKGKRSVCHSEECGKGIERGQLRIKEEYGYTVEGGETSHKYHIDCYPSLSDISVEEIEGFDKLKEKDKKAVLSKSAPTLASEKAPKQATESNTHSDEDSNEDEDNESSEEQQSPSEKKSQSGSEKASPVSPASPSSPSSPSASSTSSTSKYKNGSRVMAKAQGNTVRNIWIPAKVVSTRTSALGLPEYHVCYTEDNIKDTKEWLAERFIAPPVEEDEAPPTTFTEGMIALGWRKKPGGSTGWWYSVKVLRFLRDVPGAFVHWMDFPFPDSILNATDIHLITKETTGVKRPLESESTSAPKKEKVT